MKINFLSFTDYKLKINTYKKCDLDFFSFLLLKIITSENKENKSLKSILFDFEITEPLMYLASNAFYELIDNHLIETSLSFEEVKCLDIITNDLTYKCLENNYFLILEDSKEQSVAINPLNYKIVFNDNKYKDDYLVYNKEISLSLLNEIINENKKSLFNISDDYQIEVEILEANPLFTELNCKDVEFPLDLKEIIYDNLQYFEKENLKEYEKDFVILTKEYELEKNDKYDFIATLNKEKYGCFYYLVASNIGKIPMIKRTKLK